MSEIGYRIYSRWPKWARWKIVVPAPHAERFQFDSIGLLFSTWDEANKALEKISRWNAGEYKIVPETWRVSGNPSVENST